MAAPGLSEVRPGREHDTTALRAHHDIMPRLDELGHEGVSGTITIAFKQQGHPRQQTSTLKGSPAQQEHPLIPILMTERAKLLRKWVLLYRVVWLAHTTGLMVLFGLVRVGSRVGVFACP